MVNSSVWNLISSINGTCMSVHTNISAFKPSDNLSINILSNCQTNNYEMLEGVIIICTTLH